MDCCITDHGVPQWYLGSVLLLYMVIGAGEMCDGIVHCLMLACQLPGTCYMFTAVLV